MSKEFLKYRRAAREQVWVEKPTSKGMQLIPPDPDMPIVQVHRTPSDHRALKNLLPCGDAPQWVRVAAAHVRRTAVEWSVRVELGGNARALDPEDVSSMLERLEQNGAVASLGSRALGVRLAVRADDALAAGSKALELVRGAIREIGIADWPVVGVGTESSESLTRELERSKFGSLAGVSEVAEMLGVSKQRVSELAKTRGFPKPLVTLASGPVWPVAAIRSFARSWIRRPGPKPVVVTTGAGVKAAVAAGKVARAATAAKERAVPPKARVKA